MNDRDLREQIEDGRPHLFHEKQTVLKRLKFANKSFSQVFIRRHRFFIRTFAESCEQRVDALVSQFTQPSHLTSQMRQNHRRLAQERILTAYQILYSNVFLTFTIQSDRIIDKVSLPVR